METRRFGLHAEQCVCGLKMNKLIGRTGIAYAHSPPQSEKSNIISISLRDKKKKEGGSEKKGGGGG